jgi:hypothetical protein
MGILQVKRNRHWWAYYKWNVTATAGHTTSETESPLLGILQVKCNRHWWAYYKWNGIATAGHTTRARTSTETYIPKGCLIGFRTCVNLLECIILCPRISNPNFQQHVYNYALVKCSPYLRFAIWSPFVTTTCLTSPFQTQRCLSFLRLSEWTSLQLPSPSEKLLQAVWRQTFAYCLETTTAIDRGCLFLLLNIGTKYLAPSIDRIDLLYDNIAPISSALAVVLQVSHTDQISTWSAKRYVSNHVIFVMENCFSPGFLFLWHFTRPSGQSSPGSIPGATTFSEKQWIWNGVHSAS